jgi:hypothetical protein
VRVNKVFGPKNIAPPFPLEALQLVKLLFSIVIFNVFNIQNAPPFPLDPDNDGPIFEFPTYNLPTLPSRCITVPFPPENELFEKFEFIIVTLELDSVPPVLYINEPPDENVAFANTHVSNKTVPNSTTRTPVLLERL